MSAQVSEAFSRLIAPKGREEFSRDYWEQQPLLVERDEPGYFADLLTLGDVDRLISLSGPNLDAIRVVAEGKEVPVSALGQDRGPNGPINALEELYERYRNGSTIVLNGLDRRWAPLQRLSETLTAETGARFQFNVYLTPGGSARGFNPHYDTHDVFVLQVHGSKRWRLYESPYRLPLRTRPYDHSAPAPEVAEREFELRPGSVLYLPRGTVHAATSVDTASVHITIGVHPVLWTSVLNDALAKLVEEDVRFRAGLPIGFATDEDAQQQVERTCATLVEALGSALSPQEMTTEAVRRAVSISPSQLRGHLTDLEAAAGIGLDTKVQRRPGLSWHIARSGDRIELEFHNKKVQLPDHVADEVRFMAESSAPLTAGSLPGRLDEPGRQFLVRTLVREGFLTLC